MSPLSQFPWNETLLELLPGAELSPVADQEYVLRVGSYAYILVVFEQGRGTLDQAKQVAVACFLHRRDHPDHHCLMVAPWLTRDARAFLQTERIGYLDAQGNAWLSLPPGVSVSHTAPRQVASPRPPRSAALFTLPRTRIVRVLLNAPGAAWTMPQLSDAAGVSLSTVKATLEALAEQGLLYKRYGASCLADPARLLDLWAENWTMPTGESMVAVTPVPHSEAFRLALDRAADRLGIRYALTAHLGISLVAPFARFGVVHVYLDGPIHELAAELALEQTTGVGNVHFPLPPEGVFHGAQRIAGSWVVSLPQLYVDMWSYPARGIEGALHLRQVAMAPWSPGGSQPPAAPHSADRVG